MTPTRLTCLLTTLSLAACGGGGSGSSGNSSVPSSGSYAWVLTASGPIAGLSYGLSFVHASTPTIQYQIEAGSAVLTDSRVVSSGSVDTTQRTASALTPYALVYIIGGDVRRVPLQANGKAPATQVQRAGSTDACKFLEDTNQQSIGEAVDYGTPENSRFLVSTAGPDGVCGTSDDGAAEVRLDPSAGLVYTPLSGALPLGTFRDASSLAPAGWIFPKSVSVWQGAASAPVATRSASQPAFTHAVSSVGATALMDDGNKLSVLDMTTATAPAETPLDVGTTAGGNWNAIGNDQTAWYVYQNTGTAGTGNWTVLQITRGSPAATVLQTGQGTIEVASMGTNLLYLTVVGANGNSLLAISKSVGKPAQTLDSSTSGTLTTVQTSGTGVHELWRVTNVGTSLVGYELEFINESGYVVYLVNAGGYPMLSPAATNLSFDLSENRTQFIYANGYGLRGFGDAQLVGFDATAQANTVLGTLPGSAQFGNQTVFSNVFGGPGQLLAGFAASSANGQVSAGGEQVFSFDLTAANSLQPTSQTQ